MTEYYFRTGIYSTNPNTAGLYFTAGSAIDINSTSFSSNRKVIDASLGFGLNLHSSNKFLGKEGTSVDVEAYGSGQLNLGRIGGGVSREKSLTSGESNTSVNISTGIKSSGAQGGTRATIEHTIKTLEH